MRYMTLLLLLAIAACSSDRAVCYKPQEMQYGQIMKAVPCPEQGTEAAGQ